MQTNRTISHSSATQVCEVIPDYGNASAKMRPDLFAESVFLPTGTMRSPDLGLTQDGGKFRVVTFP